MPLVTDGCKSKLEGFLLRYGFAHMHARTRICSGKRVCIHTFGCSSVLSFVRPCLLSLLSLLVRSFLQRFFYAWAHALILLFVHLSMRARIP